MRGHRTGRRGRGGAVVIDYGRERLYLAETGNIRYLPPTVLGFAEAPGLRVEGSRYAPMIDQFKSRTESLQQTGDQAQQRVTLTGLNDRTVTYQFELSVCDEEPFENCWPTDSVLD